MPTKLTARELLFRTSTFISFEGALKAKVFWFLFISFLSFYIQVYWKKFDNKGNRPFKVLSLIVTTCEVVGEAPPPCFFSLYPHICGFNIVIKQKTLGFNKISFKFALPFLCSVQVILKLTFLQFYLQG